MNYRHIYHAGGFADVFKHVVLALMLEHMRRKDSGFFALDTHAGIGLYDLASEQAQKTQEFRQGIGEIWGRKDAPAEIRAYMDVVRSFNKGHELRYYPGSPAIIRKFLRKDDRFVAGELHEEDFRSLKKNMQDDARIRIERESGYTLIKACLPPRERRGLVLIDPPFEDRNEFTAMLKSLKDAHKRWATGVFMWWYPIKDTSVIGEYHGKLAAMGVARIKAVDFFVRKPEDPDALNGCGLILVNPPWTLAEQLGRILPWLAQAIAGGNGYFETKEIAGETP